MSVILFDNQFRKKLFPLTATKAVADIRLGIFKRKEWWQLKTNQEVFVHTAAYLQPLYETIPNGDRIWVDASLIADDGLFDRILSLDMHEALADEQGLIAGRMDIEPSSFDAANSLQYFRNIIDIPSVKRITNPQQLFQWNEAAINSHFAFIKQNKQSQSIPSSNQVVNSGNIFIEEGASVEFSILNASSGPIYIGKDATVMEGCMIRGPFALCKGAILKMGTKIYGATTIGTKSVGGGEIKNSIISDYSNKAHDGYLGDSVIGEWCNLGAGTSNSNVKNTGGNVKAFNHHSGEYENVGMKCGVVMGDYSRTAINSSINTGSVIGVCCNVFGNGLLPKLIHDFIWGTKDPTKYEFEKALADIANWKKMKAKELLPEETTMLKYIFEELHK
jgi:UDP-N-acetylglucosamine diphosphorylase/glucosamine-1-phosphate N-acetyltransferase